MKSVVFLSHESTRFYGSSLIRSEQMSMLVGNALLSKGVSVNFTTDDRNVHNSLVILNKGYLIKSTREMIKKLKQQENILIADYVDLMPPIDQLDQFDGLMASSRVQKNFFRNQTIDIPIFHVAHIVDARLATILPQDDIFAPAYFGFLENAGYQGELRELVDFYETPAGDISWMRFLPQYNCHYAVRKNQSYDGFKPFLKGFTAAHSSCPIIVSANDGDALGYLGNDYPYLIWTDTLQDCLDILEKAKDDFGSKRWKFALDIMDNIRIKTSNEYIISEFVEIILFYKDS